VGELPGGLSQGPRLECRRSPVSGTISTLLACVGVVAGPVVWGGASGSVDMSG
jgi:hypothetical protein